MSLNRRRRRSWSIRNRILVPYLALIVAMVGATGLATGHLAASLATSQYLLRGRQIADTLQRSQYPLTEATLRQMRGLGGAEFALLDREGRPITTTLESVQAHDIHIGVATVSDRTFARNLTLGGKIYRLGEILRPGPPGTRRVLILLPESTLRAVAWETRRGVLLLSLLGAILAAVVATWIGQTLSKPLSAIHRGVRRIGRGHLRPRGLPRGRTDEIGELAEGVERMARWLRKLRRDQVRTQRLKLIRQVSAGLAHEIRNPLTAARMTLQIYLERNRDRDPEPLRIALDELERVEKHVSRFLQMARPDPPTFASADVAAIVARTVAGLTGAAAHQGISIEIAPSSEDFPPGRVDPDQIAQVFANLLRNALEAAGPGGRVRVEPRGGVNLIHLDILDDGPGVDHSISTRPFRPFATTKPEGVGLGLAVCEAIIREHRGTIAYDRSDGWTRFRVTLPIADRDPGGGNHGSCDGP